MLSCIWSVGWRLLGRAWIGGNSRGNLWNAAHALLWAWQTVEGKCSDACEQEMTQNVTYFECLLVRGEFLLARKCFNLNAA